MFTPLSIFLALRYVRSRHGQGFSTFISTSSTIGIALGTMILIVVLSAMNGFEKALANKLLSIVPHAELMAVNTPIPKWSENIKRIQNLPEVAAAAPVIILTGMMQHKTQLKALDIRGVDVHLETAVSDIESYIVEGSWQALSNKSNTIDNNESIGNGIVIGAGVAKKLSVKLGDKVQLLLPSNNGAAKQSVFSAPIKRYVKIVGIFKFGGVID
ncbi:MAG: ABC transporter permease, partial [Colwellia sp.]|nr:ABC transporter permease [Colwellia sp.]